MLAICDVCKWPRACTVLVTKLVTGSMVWGMTGFCRVITSLHANPDDIAHFDLTLRTTQLAMVSEIMGRVCAINHFSSSLRVLLSLITQHVSLSLGSYSLAFTLNYAELLLCNGVGLKHPALPGVEVPDTVVLYSKVRPRMF